VAGFGVAGTDGSRVSLNVPSVGRVPNGATVERTVPNAFTQGDSLTLNLNHSDFTTARRVSEVINNLLGANTAMPLDATSIRVRAPRHPSQRVSFVSVLENLEVTPAKETAKIIINSRTGTIVIGQDVRVSPVAVTHGGLTVTITENLDVDQPNALAGGDTVITPRTGIQVDAGSGHMFNFNAGTSLQQIVDSVNQVGAAPGDLMAILEALKQSGAIKADLIVI
jgi:flagellar P-ring protein precursor FlgI